GLPRARTLHQPVLGDQPREHDPAEDHAAPAHRQLRRRRATSTSPTTANSAGSTTAVAQKSALPSSADTENCGRRGGCWRGRCEIASGWRASQSTVFRNRSLFPRYSMKKLSANLEFP